MVTYTHDPETCVVTISGQEGTLVQAIYQKVRAANGMYGMNRPHRDPFLPVLPKGQNALNISTDQNGTSSLTIQCKNTEGVGKLLHVLSNHFDISYGSMQDCGTIQEKSLKIPSFMPYKKHAADSNPESASFIPAKPSTASLKTKKQRYT